MECKPKVKFTATWCDKLLSSLGLHELLSVPLVFCLKEEAKFHFTVPQPEMLMTGSHVVDFHNYMLRMSRVCPAVMYSEEVKKPSE
jgi:hypothetical protein